VINYVVCHKYCTLKLTVNMKRKYSGGNDLDIGDTAFH
jgi:hypothetical protein